MFRASSETTVDTATWSREGKPQNPASSRPFWRAATMSVSRSIGSRTSSAMSTSLIRQSFPSCVGHVRSAIERRSAATDHRNALDDCTRWCRRGDSNPHGLPHTPLKRARLPVPPLRLAWEGFQRLKRRCYFFDGCGDDVITVEYGVAAGAAIVGDGCGVGDVTGASGTPDCKTELVPLIAGRDNIKAINMNAAAAPIVILASSVCVPRGPNAVLETELVNKAPASALPGC